MTTAARFVVIPALVLLAESAATAQPPTAPPPHPPLSELVKEYVRLGLSLPPPNAPLVRIKKIVGADGEGTAIFAYDLGFQLPPAAPGRDSRYMIGEGWRHDRWINPNRVQPVAPTTEALDDVDMKWTDWTDLVVFAVHCRLRGWDELANAAYLRVRNKTAMDADELREWFVSELHELSFNMSMDQVFQPQSDRKAMLKQLQSRIAEGHYTASKEDIVRIRRLELALAKVKARPGSVEALIDSLVDYWQEDGFPPSKKSGEEMYWKLAEMGFDAVPTLIEHLNDDRLTRTYDVTVGLLCTWLLEDLSGMEVGKNLDESTTLEPEVARAWFAKARKVGEEKYLLAHALTSNNNQEAENKRQSAGAHIFRVIGAKYPNRIRDLYHAKLKMPWSETPPDSDHIEQIVGCKLSRADKIALFEEGLRQKEIGHRIQALEGLDQLDKALFNKRLLQLLEESTASIKKRDVGAAIAFSLASIVMRSDDQLCWNAYLAAAKASPYEGPLYFIQVMNCEVGETDDPDPSRRQRIMFFVALLDDRTTQADDPNVKPDHVHYDFEVRDYAASMLSYIYQFPVTGPPYYSHRHDHQRGPLTRLLMREAVRELAKRELARPGK